VAWASAKRPDLAKAKRSARVMTRRRATRHRLFTARAYARADFHLRVHHVGVRTRNVQADAPEQPVRQTAAFEFLPGLARVDRFPDAAAWSTAVETKARAASLVGGGVERFIV